MIVEYRVYHQGKCENILVQSCISATLINTGLKFQVGQPVSQTPAITGQVKTQLIAHEKPVHDIAFTRLDNGRDQFATAGCLFL